MSAQTEAINIILGEHRSIAAVLHGMLFLMREIRERGVSPQFSVFDAMIYYIDAVPERFHHPKEERYLFALLRSRCPDSHVLLAKLEDEHKIGAEKIRFLEQALTRYRQGGHLEFEAFATSIEAYAQFEWDHMRLEEKELIPLAAKNLTEGDWSAVAAAFTSHSDPLLGYAARDQYRRLFQRILSIAPAPIGLGARDDAGS